MNAFLGPALDLLRQQLREGHLGAPCLRSAPPGPPEVWASIALSGHLNGSVQWTFEPQVAYELCRAMGFDAAPNSPELREALGEVANIIAGHAAGALYEAGYHVELEPPAVGAEPLGSRSLDVPLETPYGRVTLTFGLRPS